MDFIVTPKLMGLWIGLATVIVAEHFLLKYVYGKTSSLQRLFATRSASTHVDLVMGFIGYVLYGISNLVRLGISLIVLPGVVYLGVVWLKGHYKFSGIFGGVGPENIVVATALWLVLLDFPNYLSHWMMHKIPILWRFHQLHHSATELNVITGIRLSFGERGINSVVRYAFVFILLGIPNPGVAVSVVVIRRAIDHLQHSDLPWDYGPLGYIVASPRFHRLHHSSAIDHRDANYGNIFSFWDYLFGTVANAYDHDRTVADTCVLGLHSEELTRVHNRWYFALLQDTWLHLAWTLAQTRFGKRSSTA